MVMRGRAGAWVATDVWSTDEPAHMQLLVKADVEVLELLEQVSPWSGRAFVIEDGMLVLGEPT